MPKLRRASDENMSLKAAARRRISQPDTVVSMAVFKSGTLERLNGRGGVRCDGGPKRQDAVKPCKMDAVHSTVLISQRYSSYERASEAIENFDLGS